MNSCLYQCAVMHHRIAPKEHHFNHEIFMIYVDLDELGQLTKTLLFGYNRRGFYRFNDSDHMPQGTGGLKARVMAYLSRHDIQFPTDGKIMLLTLPRVLGYIFNPISVYFCFDAAGAPICSVAEVGNTFREMKLFLLTREEMEAGRFCKVTTKNFYVSPFSGLDLTFDFKFQIPGESLDLRVDDRDGDQKVLLTQLTGRRAAFTSRNLLWFSIKYPLVTLKVIFLIHWHALRLYLKRVPFHRKAANQSQQLDVLNPHASLTGKIK